MEIWWLCVLLLPLICVRGEGLDILNFVKQHTSDNDDVAQEYEQGSGTRDSIENAVKNSTEDVQPSSTVNKRDPSSLNKAADDAWAREKGKYLAKWEKDKGTVKTELTRVKGITTEELTEYTADVTKKYDKLKKDMTAKASLTDDVLKDVKKRVEKSASRETPNVQQWQTRYLGATTIVTSNIKTLVDQVNDDDVWGALGTGCSMLSGIFALVPHPAGIFAATVLNIASFAFGLSGKAQADPYKKVYEKINQAVDKITQHDRKIEMARLMAPLEETNRISKRLIRRMGKQFGFYEFFFWALTNNLPRMDAFVETLAEIAGFAKMMRKELIEDNTHILLLTTYAQISILRDTILTTLVAQLPDEGKNEGKDLVSLKNEYFDTLNEGRKAAFQFLGELHKPTPTNMEYVSWYYVRDEGDSDRKLVYTYLKYLTYYEKDVEAKQEVIYTMPHAWTYDEIIMKNAQFSIDCEEGKTLVLGGELKFLDKKKGSCSVLKGQTWDRVNGPSCAAEKKTKIGYQLECKSNGNTDNNFRYFKFEKSGSKYKLKYYSTSGTHYYGRDVMFHEMNKNGWKTEYPNAEGHEFKAYISENTKGEWTRHGATETKVFHIIPYNSDTNDPANTLKIMFVGGDNRFAYQGYYGRVTFQEYGPYYSPSKFTLKITNLNKIKAELVKKYPKANNVVNVEQNIHDILNALRFPDPPPPS